MAKTIKFNLICDNTPVRTIEDLQNNFSIEDVLDYYRNGLLCRWLKVRGYEKELKKVEEIRSEDSMGIIKELIRIFEIPCDPAEVEKSIYILKYKVESESENEQYKQEGYKVEGIIEDYQQGYRSLLNTIFENQNDAAQIKAAIQEIVEKYKWVLQYDYRRVLRELIDQKTRPAPSPMRRRSGRRRPVTNAARPGEQATVPDRLRMLRIRPRPNPLTPMALRPSIRSSKT